MSRFVQELSLNNKIISKEVENDYQILTGIEEIQKQKKKIRFKGWVCRVDSVVERTIVLLRAIDFEEYLILDMEYEVRNDINDFFCLSKREESGFIATIDMDKVKDNVSYEILIALQYKTEQDEEKLVKIHTNQYLYNGNLYRYNPQKFVKPIMQDKKLEKIINDGELYFFCADHELWLYLYDNKLCWIMNSTLVSPIEKLAGIPWNIYTFRKELIKSGKDSIYSTYYEPYLTENESVIEENIKYYYLIEDIPKEYPVTYVRTGIWKNEQWVCKAVFQIFELGR